MAYLLAFNLVETVSSGNRIRSPIQLPSADNNATFTEIIILNWYVYGIIALIPLIIYFLKQYFKGLKLYYISFSHFIFPKQSVLKFK